MSAGGSQGSSDTRFERKGTAMTNSFRELSPEHKNNFSTGLSATSPGAVGPEVQSHITTTLGQGNADIPFQPEMAQLINANLPGTQVPGQAGLEAQSQIDPYSSSYADDTFKRYSQEVGQMLSNVSGPLATRGGTAAQGFMAQESLNNLALNREDVLTQNRRADAGIQQGASGALHGMQGRDTMEAMQGIGQQQGAWQGLLGNQNQAGGLGNQQGELYSQMAQNLASLEAPVHGTETNDLSGRGGQSSSAMGANMSLCCFIFLESYNGKLPWWVRECRDQMAPECSKRREGYIRMANRLVPWMKKSRVVRWMTDKFMVDPITKWGGYYKQVPGYDKCWVYKPFVKFWFAVWTKLGNRKNK